MPLWRIFHPKDLYTPEEKRAFSTAITKIYSTLPEFYVNVFFIPLDSDDCFIGGQSRSNFVRIVIEQIARRFDPSDKERKLLWMEKIELAIAPWVKGKGKDLVGDWEIHIAETDRDLWNVSGYTPPPQFSEAEKLWKSENKAVPYVHLLE